MQKLHEEFGVGTKCLSHVGVRLMQQHSADSRLKEVAHS